MIRIQRNRAKSFKNWILESKYQPGLRIPSNQDFDDNEISILKDINWTDLDWKEVGNDGHSIVWLKCMLPIDLDLSESVIVDVQIIRDTFYQIHISISEEIRGIGLGTKIYRSLVNWLGHIYSGRGRRHNPIINKVLDRIKSDPGVVCKSNNLGDICISRKNPDGKRLASIFRRIGTN